MKIESTTVCCNDWILRSGCINFAVQENTVGLIEYFAGKYRFHI